MQSPWPMTWLERLGNTAWGWSRACPRVGVQIWPLAVDVLLGLFVVLALGGLNEAIRRWRGRPFQFSLRTALGAMTLACLLMGWWTYRYRDEQAAADEILLLDTRRDAVFEYENDAPEWLREWFAHFKLNSPFVHLKTVTVTLDQLADSSAALHRLPRLRELYCLDPQDYRRDNDHKLDVPPASLQFPYVILFFHGIGELNTKASNIPKEIADVILPTLRAIATEFPDLEIVVLNGI